MVKLSTFNKKITFIKLELDNRPPREYAGIRLSVVISHIPKKGPSTQGCVCNIKTIQRFLRYSPKTELIICHHVVNKGLNIKGQKLIQRQ